MNEVPGARLEAIVERARTRAGGRRGPAPTEAERAVLEALESHAESEAETLRVYQELVDATPDEHVRFLARLILDDEQRHHTILSGMLNRVRADIEWCEVKGATPYVRPVHDRRALLATVERLVASERDDLRKIRALKRRLRRRRATSLLWLMADMLECDTRKHLRILGFLRSGARG